MYLTMNQISDKLYVPYAPSKEIMAWQNPRTASPQDSIYLETPEDEFRHHLVGLESKTNSIPIDPQIFSPQDWLANSSHGSHGSHILPLEIEQRVTDDFAFLAAVTEGAQSVAAVCLEEESSPPGITLRFATLDSLLDSSIKEGLYGISQILMSHASLPPPNTSVQEDANLRRLSTSIIALHQTRLLARLRSKKWNKPKYLSKSHKSPLHENFSTLLHRTTFLYSKSGKGLLRSTQSLIADLHKLYTTFEILPLSDTISDLKDLIHASYTFCSSPLIKTFSSRLQNSQKAKKPTPQIASAIKTLRQIEKIAAYKRVCISLLETSRSYGNLFEDIRMEYLQPYNGVETKIGYETWATRMHVHAEVQLVVYYDILHSRSQANSSSSLPNIKEERRDRDISGIKSKPRCIGTSKLLCYLCYHFLRAHGTFFPSRTHGRLYDQWTIPDLKEYDEDIVMRYRGIAREMDEVVVEASDAEGQLWRLMPMTSVDSGPFEESKVTSLLQIV